jgi:hypothetical protein
MENVSFSSEGQNIYITYTRANGIVSKELYCISTGVSEASIITKSLNYACKNDPEFYL